MNLAQIPINAAYRIEALGCAVRDMTYYITAGLRPGNLVRVLARYPDGHPRFAEVDLGSLIITLPLNVAEDVSVSAP